MTKFKKTISWVLTCSLRMTRYLVIWFGLAFPAEFIFDISSWLPCPSVEFYLTFLQNLEIEYRFKNFDFLIYSFCHVFHKLYTCIRKTIVSWRDTLLSAIMKQQSTINNFINIFIHSLLPMTRYLVMKLFTKSLIIWFKKVLYKTFLNLEPWK